MCCDIYKHDMKILYVAPRFHTNQVPIMKGFLEAGDEVKFISQYQGGTEDYTVIKPVVLGYSALFNVILRLVNGLKKLTGRYRKNDFNFQAKFGFLPKRKFKKLLEEMQPDAVILRDRSVYNIAITTICKKKKIKCILYTQSPYYGAAAQSRNPIKQYFRRHTPSVEITPVLGRKANNEVQDVSSMRTPACAGANTYYVPFVIEPYLSYEKKSYFEQGQIHILGVGKYEPRKHHEMLIRIAQEFAEIPLHVTIVGEDVTAEEHAYLQKLQASVRDQGLEERVTFQCNLSREEVFREYEQADIFALPSTGEFASVSQLEAMSVSLPVICSDTNGTSCYISEGLNGYLFRDNDYEDFKAKMELLLQDKETIRSMGKESYRKVSEEYSFLNYKQRLTEILEKMQETEVK